MKAQTLLVIVAPTLLPNKLESRETIIVYNPQQVLRQFSYDQGIQQDGVWLEYIRSSWAMGHHQIGRSRDYSALARARCSSIAWGCSIMAEVPGGSYLFVAEKGEDVN